MTIELTATQRAKNGADFLDANSEISDWRKKIKLSDLCLDSPVSCVLGQLYSDYEIGCDALGLLPYGTSAPRDLGFMPLGFNDGTQLRRAWIDMLAAA